VLVRSFVGVEKVFLCVFLVVNEEIFKLFSVRV